MPIADDKLRSLGIDLKRQAKKRGIPVDDAFVIELGNYARHRVVEELDDLDTVIVLQKIGERAMKTYGTLDGAAIRATVQKLCRPKTGFDLCAATARNILRVMGKQDAVKKLDAAKAWLHQNWNLDE